MSDRYKGPPDYADVPLGYSEAELYAGAGSDFQGALEQAQAELAQPAVEVEYGVPDLGIGYGDPRHDYSEVNQVIGAANLRPFPDGGAWCPPDVVPVRVPAYPHEEVVQRGLRIFSQWGDRTGGTTADLVRRETPATWQSVRIVRSPIVPGGGSALWSIDVWAYEVSRTLTAEQGPVAPLRDRRIIEEGGAARVNFPGNQASRLKARIMWAASSGGATRVIDIGQGIRMALEATMVTVEVLYPAPGTIQLDGEAEGPFLAADGGTVLDSEVGIQVVPTSSTPGAQQATNTITVEVLAGVTDRIVLIPPGTRTVTIVQTGDGAPMVPSWNNGRDPVNPGQDIGQITLGAGRRADNVSRPGSAGSIRTGPSDDNFDRWVTFIFELEI